MLKGKLKIVAIYISIFMVMFVEQTVFAPISEGASNTVKNEVLEVKSAISTKFVPLGIPNINSSFKPYMDYRAITDKNSPQYKFIQQWGWSDYEGFMRCNGEKDLGVEDNYYLIALGSYYGTEIGTKYRITTDTGRVFYGVLADCKANMHTNSTNQYGNNRDVVEFLVDTRKLNKSVKYHGTANVYMPLNGSVTKIERIEFTTK